MPSTSPRPIHIPLTRRLMLAAGAVLSVLPIAAAHASAQADSDMANVLAGRTPKEGGPLKLDIPSIAENGLVVPLAVEMDSPMTEADHVIAIHIFADGNPVPSVATFRFTPDSGKAAASTRIRLAQTQNVVAIAETSTGGLFRAQSEVKVTIGGCGG